MTDRPVENRLVFHIGGYDAIPPQAAYRRFQRGLQRFQSTWSVSAHAGDLELTDDAAHWVIASTGGNWRVQTEYRLLRWDDVIATAGRRPHWVRIPRAVVAFCDFVAAGALWGYLLANWRYALFFLYPYVLLAATFAIAIVTGNVTSGSAGLALGSLAGASCFLLLLRVIGSLYVFHLLDDWIFSRDYIRNGDPVLNARLERAARQIVLAAEERRWDEILVIGHSLGAVLAVDLLDRALRINSGIGEQRARLVFLSIGSSILKIALHRAAVEFRESLQRVSSSAGIFWGEYQALSDAMNFYKTNPLAQLGLTAARGPMVRVIRISRLLSPAEYLRIRRNFFRMHNQFVSGNDRRAAYDYFMFVCGPIYAERLVRTRDGAVAAIASDGSLLNVVADESSSSSIGKA